MTDQTAFEYRDETAARLSVAAVQANTHHGTVPVVALLTEHPDGDDVPVVYVPLDRVEEVVAGVRDAARQAAGQPAAETPQPAPTVPCGQCGAPWSDGHGQPGDPCTPTPAVGGQDATPPADRAAILREAADAVERIPTGDCSDADSYDEAWDWGARAAANVLRRMADEATP
ncbi:hypothetical protein [Streptomyces sp. NPDC046332]|uniref:hypothetical protein n=1 Tax=unclassified Streptomyces TaxID=2593676 RepID=UPI0033C727D3